jgi:recombinational DNA repair ATPase RecF
MRLHRIQIDNFRGITSLDLTLGDTTVLIGENNTGKTAVLDALRFALREVKLRRGCASVTLKVGARFDALTHPQPSELGHGDSRLPIRRKRR